MSNQSTTSLRQAISGIRTAMLTTFDKEGHLHSRPMATIDIQFDGDLWFFTRADSPKVSELGSDARVNVSYADVGRNRFVSVSGRAEIVRDEFLLRKYWKPIYRAWFPKGIHDPQLSLLRVNAEQAEIWDRPFARVHVILQFVRAALTGKFREPSGNGRKIDLAA